MTERLIQNRATSWQDFITSIEDKAKMYYWRRYLMRLRLFTKRALIVAAILGCNISLAGTNETVLNRAQSAYLSNLINSQLKNQDDRHYIFDHWSEAQRVAEFICAPLAKNLIKQRFPDVDKIILDQGPDNKQKLISSTLLAGNGQYRVGNTWTPFSYECELSDQTGKATKFRILNREKVVVAPGPVIPGKGVTE
ncbi:hypothetical protein KFS96_004016 [Salmonella enterica]|nr:hypothetical protein [Salmonella enterica]